VKSTFVDSYEMKTRELRTLHTFKDVVDVIRSSVNEERTLLGAKFFYPLSN